MEDGKKFHELSLPNTASRSSSRASRVGEAVQNFWGIETMQDTGESGFLYEFDWVDTFPGEWPFQVATDYLDIPEMSYIVDCRAYGNSSVEGLYPMIPFSERSILTQHDFVYTRRRTVSWMCRIAVGYETEPSFREYYATHRNRQVFCWTSAPRGMLSYVPAEYVQSIRVDPMTVPVLSMYPDDWYETPWRDDIASSTTPPTPDRSHVGIAARLAYNKLIGKEGL